MNFYINDKKLGDVVIEFAQYIDQISRTVACARTNLQSEMATKLATLHPAEAEFRVPFDEKRVRDSLRMQEEIVNRCISFCNMMNQDSAKPSQF